MKKETGDAPVSRMLLWAIAVLVAARLISLALYPLMDTTEARYGDIARRMVERSDWITPWFTDKQPFWGKPPLSFWATALGFKLFGINEFAGRLPHLILGICVGALTWMYARHQSSRTAWHAVALLGGTLLFVVSSGAVMTDMSLTLGTTLVMVGFWMAIRDRVGGTWLGQSLMALGFIIGLLGKGPLVLVLCAMPIGAWLLWQRRVVDAWRRIAWLRMLLFVLVFSLPWYITAEIHTPGFLNYFLVGEHWQRFVNAGWTGDKYGAAHAFPHGAIWLFELGAIAPWPFLLVPLSLVNRGSQNSSSSAEVKDGERLYLLLWGLWPCVFFTLSGNVIWTYVLPGLPALALLAALWTSKQSGESTERVLTIGVWISTATLVVCVALANKADYLSRSSAKELMTDYQVQARVTDALYYFGEVPFSVSFYSDGRAQHLSRLEDLDSNWPGRTALVAMSLDQYEALSEETKLRFTELSRRGPRLLLRWQ